jgi:hypothetical protein
MIEAGFPGQSPRKKTGCATKLCTSQTPLWQPRSETLWVPSPSDICQTGKGNMRSPSFVTKLLEIGLFSRLSLLIYVLN